MMTHNSIGQYQAATGATARSGALGILVGWLLACVLAAAWSGAARAVVVADFAADYTTPTPAAGWAYQWNALGPIGTPANYQNLVFDPAVFGDGAYVACPGFYPCEPPTDPNQPARFLTVYQDGIVHPGSGTAQEPIARYAIVAFTLSTSGFTAIINGSLSDDDPQVNPELFDGVNLLIAVNDNPPVFTTSINNTDETSFNYIPLGNLNAGDTIYVALGANGPEGINNDFNDRAQLLFQIDQGPAPAGAPVPALSMVGALMTALALLLAGIATIRRRQGPG